MSMPSDMARGRDVVPVGKGSDMDFEKGLTRYTRVNSRDVKFNLARHRRWKPLFSKSPKSMSGKYFPAGRQFD